MSSEISKLKRIIHLGLGLSGIHDIDLLLEKILEDARIFTSADAGSIYLREGNRLLFSYTQNETLQKNLPAGKKLIYSTFSIPIDKSSIAGYVAKAGCTLNIPDVKTIESSAPYSFDGSYDCITGYHTRSVLAFPLKTLHGNVVGVLQLINAKDPEGNVRAFPKDEEPLLASFADTAASAVERAKLTRGIIMRMNKMAELRDPGETGAHVKRVSAYSVAIYEGWARKQGIGAEEVQRNRDLLRIAAMLHDVGKVAISDVILKKPGRLTPEEFEIMKQHTVHGGRLFEELYSDMDEAASIVALNHHERWDGNGYPGVALMDSGKPQGKRGEEIPLFGRIVAIADVYDALRSRRCYKEAWDEGACLEHLRKESGQHFDPQLIDAFFDNLEVINHASELYPEVDHQDQ